MKIFNYSLELLIVLSIICCLTVITSTNPVIAIIYLIGVFLNAAIYLILIGLGFIGLSYIIVYIGAITVLFLFVIMMLNTDILDIVEIGPEYGKNLPLAYTISILFFIFFILLIPGLINSFNAGYGIDSYNLGIFKFYNNFISNDYLSLFNNQELMSNSHLGLCAAHFTADATNTTFNFSSGIANSSLNPESSLINILQIETLGELLYSQGAILLIITSFILLLALITPIILSKK